MHLEQKTGETLSALHVSRNCATPEERISLAVNRVLFEEEATRDKTELCP